jgi:hypothetical protein
MITKIYPIDLYLEEQLFQELYGISEANEVKARHISDESQFMLEPKKIFGAETTINIIRNFSSQTHEKIRTIKPVRSITRTKRVPIKKITRAKP